MPHTVFTRDAGGGIYSRPVPENFVDFGAMAYALTQSNFQRCVLASLTASSTAVRAANVVTITSTAHGVPATYNGARIYYPGSPTLAAGWVDNITVTGANTITFPSIGADFGSESINAGAAYVTATNIPGGILIPAGMIADTTAGKYIINTTSLNTAATKTFRPFLGGAGFGPAQTGTTFCCSGKEWDFALLNTSFIACQVTAPNNGGGSGIGGSLAFNTQIDNTILTQLTVSAAQDFVALLAPPKIILFR